MTVELVARLEDSARHSVSTPIRNHFSGDRDAMVRLVGQGSNDVLEDREPVPGKKIKYSYPYLIRGNNNDYHLFYTWQKERIKYVHFNDAWLANRL